MLNVCIAFHFSGPILDYRASPAAWNLTVLFATRHQWTRSALTPDKLWKITTLLKYAFWVSILYKKYYIHKCAYKLTTKSLQTIFRHQRTKQVIWTKLTRRAKAYSSSCSQVIVVYLHPFRRNSLFCSQRSPKNHVQSIFLGFKVIQGHRCW